MWKKLTLLSENVYICVTVELQYSFLISGYLFEVNQRCAHEDGLQYGKYSHLHEEKLTSNPYLMFHVHAEIAHVPIGDSHL